MSLRVIKTLIKQQAKFMEDQGIYRGWNYENIQREFNKLTRRQQKRIIYKAQAHRFIRKVTDNLTVKEKVKNDRPSN